MNLKRVKHDLKTSLWCGPAAMSAITGRTTSECREAIRDARYGDSGEGRSAVIKGVRNREVTQALRAMGWSVLLVYDAAAFTMRERPTLAKFLRKRRRTARSNALLINVTGHYVAVLRRKFLDNLQTVPVNVKDAHCRRARVKKAWMVWKTEAPAGRAHSQQGATS